MHCRSFGRNGPSVNVDRALHRTTVSPRNSGAPTSMPRLLLLLLLALPAVAAAAGFGAGATTSARRNGSTAVISGVVGSTYRFLQSTCVVAPSTRARVAVEHGPKKHHQDVNLALLVMEGGALGRLYERHFDGQGLA